MRLVIALALTAACRSRESPPAAATRAPADASTAYTTAAAAVAACRLDGYEVDPTCPAMLALAKLPAPGDPEITAAALFANPAPPVRVVGANLLAAAPGAAGVTILTTAAARETDPGVLAAIVRAASTAAASEPRAASLIVGLAAHASPAVRLQAVYALAASWNRGVPGGAARLVAIVDGDRDARVREAACSSAGALADSATLLPMYIRHTGPTEEPAMLAACMRGLATMFVHDPLYDTHEAGAYALYVRRLAETPRTIDRPPWSALGVFQHFDDAQDVHLASWKRDATWFDRDALIALLVAIATDRAASWMARTTAIRSLTGLGVTRDGLLAIRAHYPDATGDDLQIVTAIEQALQVTGTRSSPSPQTRSP